MNTINRRALLAGVAASLPAAACAAPLATTPAVGFAEAVAGHIQAIRDLVERHGPEGCRGMALMWMSDGEAINPAKISIAVRHADGSIGGAIANSPEWKVL